ncbi:Rieske 2Fe-2S domain-containing protein [Algoriphagus halophytocola]|uniref:Rieske 2Fe-2S domain-containing protein n=1 Tax=Algoriphagus halophytocola TaxID=2991499 RepID=A0ABY6MDY8_9BACT|nr:MULTISPECIES: Rieske 2Fe-2S domain-containing protein [unclassified Algoriphagus]UZD22002.1 Rieske 2Fe-2S domain-containing protein [Algoriphagus sp. TR-M5]WBL43253.1 Rieske 2Fe-2S domain-containing protein [Algoriphagus sp. TR-M9]
MVKTFILGESKQQVLEMLSEKSIHKIHLDQKVIALVRSNETFLAFQSECPHRGASLFQGRLTETNEIVCPMHEYRFDLKTGKLKVGSCGDLETYPTELTENGLKISIFPT